MPAGPRPVPKAPPAPARDTSALARRSAKDTLKRVAGIKDRLQAIHGTRYIYASEGFGRTNEPVVVTCRIHGAFTQRLDHHLRGSGCPQCGSISTARAKRRRARETFAEKASAVHGGKYGYDSVKYFDARTSVLVTCRLHGPFSIKPTDHLSGRGCRRCGYESVSAAQSVDREHVLLKYRQVHGDRYDYSMFIYNGAHKKVIILCRVHGPFAATSSDHAAGTGCKECAWEKLANERRLTAEQLKHRISQVHGDKYAYDFSGYHNNESKLRITCPHHGEFQQAAGSHLSGRGCPACAAPLGEQVVAAVLDAAQVNYIRQFMHETCRGRTRRLPFDFAIPCQRVLIEFDGVHHSKPVRWSYTISDARADEIFKERQHLDSIKTRWALDNNWRLVRLTDPRTVEAELVEQGVIGALAAHGGRA